MTAATTSQPKGPSRRAVLTAGLAGLATGTLGTAAIASQTDQQPTSNVGPARVAFFGAHQAGISTMTQSHGMFLAYDLGDIDRADLVRLLRLWTDDAARLTQGEAALADTEPELASNPARLTITLGLGPHALDVARVPRDERHGVGSLPSFTIDHLQERWSGGDLLLQVCGDDALSVSHAARMLSKDVRTFGSLRWRQDGFSQQGVATMAGETPRNLMGQVDGSANPTPDSQDFAETVWVEGGRMTGGTTLVLRRIQTLLSDWDRLDRHDRELVIGRRLADGAPLTGDDEGDVPDFDAVDERGLPVIPTFAHIRRAHPSVTGARIHRRSFSYERPPDEAGLLFVSFQADIDEQFVPIQRSLAELDQLNRWTRAVGSATFLIPPGCEPGGYLGDALF
jgi:dye decolorizing peroxidase